MPSDVVQPSDCWGHLRQGGGTSTGISIPTISSSIMTPHGPVRHALGPEGEARVLLPLGMHERFPILTKSTALLIADVSYEQHGKSVRFVDITCRITELEFVFSDLVRALLQRIAEGHACSEALRCTLADFRSLLQEPGSKEVSDAEIIGLVGELLIADRFLEYNADAWEIWKGPSRERHDFRRGAYALEVKTTSRSSNNMVSISRVDQLEAPAGGELYLAHVVIEKATDGEYTVAGLVNAVKSRASSPDRVEQIVESLGCGKPDSDAWNRLAFHLEKITFYAVKEAFPRVTKSAFVAGELPAGVEAMEYVINLDLAREYVLDQNQVESMELKLA